MPQLELVDVRYVDLAKSDHRGVLATYRHGAFEFDVLSANLQYTDSPEDMVATIDRAASYRAVVINAQEAMTPVQRAKLDGLKGYDVFWPGGRDKTGRPKASPMNYNPILFRTDVARFVRGAWHQAHKGLLHVSPTRGVSEAVLDIAGLFDFDDLNVHTVNGVDGAGRTPKTWRRRKHAKNLRLVAKLIAEAAGRGPVAASGDFNTTRLRALLPLEGARFDVPAEGGSHGARPIDYWVRPKAHAEPTPEVPPMADDRYEKTTHDGKTVDKWTKAALQAAEADLGYELSVVQGSYNGTAVSASAGTHAGGGVVDLLAWDHVNKVRALRKAGFAAWYRPTIKGLWNAHIHAVLIGNEKAAPSAQRQVTAYKAGRDGLKGNAVDTTWRPSPIPTAPYPGKAVTPAKPAAPAKPKPPATPRADATYVALRVARNTLTAIVADDKNVSAADRTRAKVALASVKVAIKIARRLSTKH